MLERHSKSSFLKKFKQDYPEAFVYHTDAEQIQGIPDTLITYKEKWLTLEFKKDSASTHRPNQDYYVHLHNELSFSRFLYPEIFDKVRCEIDVFLKGDTSVKFNEHPELEGKHSTLSPSQSSWVNYDDDKFTLTYLNKMAAQQGTILHEYASQSIKLGQRLPDEKKTLNMFVNDSIDNCMDSEVILHYSGHAFGTVDAIKFEDMHLSISDFKSGLTKASFRQLEVYAAYFCLEYDLKPEELTYDLRIYQFDEIHYHETNSDTVIHIMHQIRQFNARIIEIERGDIYV